MTEETIPLVTEEMTLDEYVGVLPSGHRAHAELAALKRDEQRVVLRPEDWHSTAYELFQTVRSVGEEEGVQILANALAAADTPSEVPRPSAGVAAIAEERARQVAKEGWTPEHDDDHDNGSLAAAAATYALVAREQALGDKGPFRSNPDLWPWEAKWFKPRDQRRNLVRAGALIAAELDRLDRISPVPRPEPVRPPDIRHIHDPKG
jgi:hypothetical protein